VATATRTNVALRPSEEIRQAQTILRSILLAEDLRDDPLMLESVIMRLDELQMELGELSGKQQMFEAWTKS
jgi:hypothetical protein